LVGGTGQCAAASYRHRTARAKRLALRLLHMEKESSRRTGRDGGVPCALVPPLSRVVVVVVDWWLPLPIATPRLVRRLARRLPGSEW